MKKRTTRFRIPATLAASALALAGCASPADDGRRGADGEDQPQITLQFNSFLGPMIPQAIALQAVFDEIEARSNGSIQIEEFWEGALLSAPDSLAGVANGRVDMAHVAALYHPAELPLSQVIGIPFVTSDPAASQTTFTELYATHEAYREEWENQGVRVLYFFGTPASAVGGKDPVEDLSWFRGKSIRSTGAIAAAIQQAGGNPVALQAVEVYEALQRGTIDGWSNNILDTAVVNQSVQEVAPWVAETGLGLYTFTTIVINPVVWDSMSPEQQRIFEDITEELHQRYLDELVLVDDQACEMLIEAGGGATQWSEGEISEWRDLVGDSALEQWKRDVRDRGVDPDPFYAVYSDLLSNADSDYVNGISRCAETTSAQ